jgi:hypothetical protein
MGLFFIKTGTLEKTVVMLTVFHYSDIIESNHYQITDQYHYLSKIIYK